MLSQVGPACGTSMPTSDPIERLIWEKCVLLVGLSGTSTSIRVNQLAPSVKTSERGYFSEISCMMLSKSDGLIDGLRLFQTSAYDSSPTRARGGSLPVSTGATDDTIPSTILTNYRLSINCCSVKHLFSRCDPSWQLSQAMHTYCCYPGSISGPYGSPKLNNFHSNLLSHMWFYCLLHAV